MRVAVTSTAVSLALATACGDNEPSFSVVVFDRQTEWSHTSARAAADAIESMAAFHGWSVRTSDDPTIFSDENLATTDVIVFALTSGNVLDAETRPRLEAYFRAGGGFVAIHSAAHTEFAWPFYYTLVPVFFRTHPAPPYAPSNVLEGELDVTSTSPIVDGLPNPWVHADEFYVFYERPENIAGLDVLLSLDEDATADYPAELRVGAHPLAFSHENEGVRAFYTALGHTDESYTEPAFLQMLEQGIEWAGANRLGARDRQ